jgi:AraC-like DNA-binding protein
MEARDRGHPIGRMASVVESGHGRVGRVTGSAPADLVDDTFRRIVRAFESVGVPAEAVWGAFDRARQADGFASFQEMIAAGRPAVGAAWARAYQSLPPFCAVYAGASTPVGTYPIVDYLGVSCATMAEGMARLARYFTLIRPGVTFEFSNVGTRVRFDLMDSSREQWFTDEWTLGITLQRFRVATGREFPLREARFRRRARGDLDLGKLTAFLGCAPELEAEHAGFSVDGDIWESPLVMRDERMRESLEAHAERVLREHTASEGELRRRVREVVARALRGGDPSVQATAKALGTTPRTLQRKLSDEGSSYQALVDDVRAELADRYLEAEGLSVTEVAFLLGYSEASAFARAYRRWKGKSPAESKRAR